MQSIDDNTTDTTQTSPEGPNTQTGYVTPAAKKDYTPYIFVAVIALIVLSVFIFN